MPMAMYAAAREAVDRARARRGPDADRGDDLPLPRPRLRRRRRLHGQGREGRRRWPRDPVPRFARWLIAGGIATEARARRDRGGDRGRDRRRGRVRPRPVRFPDAGRTCDATSIAEEIAHERDLTRRPPTPITMRRRRSTRRSTTRWRPTRASSCSARTSPTRKAAASSASPRACRPDIGDQRVRSTPISEQAIIGAAIGAAHGRHAAGRRDHADELHRRWRWTMIVNHAAKLRFMSGGQTNVPIDDPHHDRRGLRFRRPALPTCSKPGSRTRPG